MSRPFSSPEFLRTVQPVPYDHQEEEQALRWRTEQASYAYRQFLERERRHAVKKNVLAIAGLCIFMAVMIVGCCLL